MNFIFQTPNLLSGVLPFIAKKAFRAAIIGQPGADRIIVGTYLPKDDILL
jgi:hypothetical protein